jgi:hypothetical protein
VRVLAAPITIGVLPLPGQSSSSGIDIYSAALIEASDQMENQWGNIPPNPGQTATDYKHLLVYKGRTRRRKVPRNCSRTKVCGSPFIDYCRRYTITLSGSDFPGDRTTDVSVAPSADMVRVVIAMGAPSRRHVVSTV